MKTARTTARVAAKAPPTPKNPADTTSPIQRTRFMPTESPVKRARASRNLSRRQFAAALGVSYSLIGSLEAGDLVAIAPTLRSGVEAVGLDFDELAKQYAEWRAEWAVQVRKEAANG